MIYFLELEDLKQHKLQTIEADSESLLEELSPRIKAAFDYEYADYGEHEFHFNGHIYVPDDGVGAIQEMSFETWEPAENQDDSIDNEEPDWYDLYQSSNIPLSEVFTVLGSAVKYKQGYLTEARITLIAKKELPDIGLDEHFEQYDYLQDEIL